MRVRIKAYNTQVDEDFPFLSYFDGKKFKIIGNEDQILFYAVRMSRKITVFDGTGRESHE